MTPRRKLIRAMTCEAVYDELSDLWLRWRFEPDFTTDEHLTFAFLAMETHRRATDRYQRNHRCATTPCRFKDQTGIERPPAAD